MEHNNTEIAEIKNQIILMMSRQDEIVKLLAENNVLLRRNLGLFEITQTMFPIESEENLQKLENDLKSDKKIEIVGSIKRILAGSLKNVDRVLSKAVIMEFNYKGDKNKKSLITYGNVCTALYDATKTEGDTYEDFISTLRTTFRRIKNTCNKEKARKENKKSNEDKENN